jgi:thiosulfate/3-mercaptopyruvate sulfurtransferase
MFTTLIRPEVLASHLSTVKVLDASWHMPNTGRKGAEEFVAQHIPGARFFDIDAASDSTSPYPHMLPSADLFQSYVRKLGIHAGDQIVVYDTLGLFSAARVWWMFRVFGHEKVAVLDGGLPAWKASGLPLASGELASAPEGDFAAQFHPELLATIR